MDFLLIAAAAGGFLFFVEVLLKINNPKPEEKREQKKVETNVEVQKPAEHIEVELTVEPDKGLSPHKMTTYLHKEVEVSSDGTNWEKRQLLAIVTNEGFDYPFITNNKLVKGATTSWIYARPLTEEEPPKEEPPKEEHPIKKGMWVRVDHGCPHCEGKIKEVKETVGKSKSVVKIECNGKTTTIQTSSLTPLPFQPGDRVVFDVGDKKLRADLVNQKGTVLLPPASGNLVRVILDKPYKTATEFPYYKTATEFMTGACNLRRIEDDQPPPSAAQPQKVVNAADVDNATKDREVPNELPKGTRVKITNRSFPDFFGKEGTIKGLAENRSGSEPQLMYALDIDGKYAQFYRSSFEVLPDEDDPFQPGVWVRINNANNPDNIGMNAKIVQTYNRDVEVELGCKHHTFSKNKLSVLPFQPGDCVTITEGQYTGKEGTILEPLTTQDWVTVEVQSAKTHKIRTKFDRLKHAEDPTTTDNKNAPPPPPPAPPEQEVVFKEGDRVVITHTAKRTGLVGMTGTVAVLTCGGDASVVTDQPVDGHARWTVPVDVLEHYKVKVGDRVAIQNHSALYNDAEGVVENTTSDTVGIRLDHPVATARYVSVVPKSVRPAPEFCEGMLVEIVNAHNKDNIGLIRKVVGETPKDVILDWNGGNRNFGKVFVRRCRFQINDRVRIVSSINGDLVGKHGKVTKTTDNKGLIWVALYEPVNCQTNWTLNINNLELANFRVGDKVRVVTWPISKRIGQTGNIVEIGENSATVRLDDQTGNIQGSLKNFRHVQAPDFRKEMWVKVMQAKNKSMIGKVYQIVVVRDYDLGIRLPSGNIGFFLFSAVKPLPFQPKDEVLVDNGGPLQGYTVIIEHPVDLTGECFQVHAPWHSTFKKWHLKTKDLRHT